MPETSTHGLAAPRMAVSNANHEFDPLGPTWRLSKDVTLNVDMVTCALTPPLRRPYRMVMKYYAENYAARYCENIHAGVQKFLTDMDVDRFSLTALRNYRASLNRETEYRLATMRAFLLRWHDQGYPGVSAETAKWLTAVRLKGNQKGRPVRSMDPHDGPFDDLELSAILNAAPQEYGRGRIDLFTLACTLLLALTGRRPLQISLLRIRDIRQTVNSEGRTINVLSIPRVKQRGQSPRTEFRHFWLPTDVYGMLQTISRIVVEKGEAQLGKLPGALTEELPIFPNWTQLKSIHSEQELREALSSDALHVRTESIRRSLSRIRAVSARTGHKLHITPRRFRYTMGCRAAREGHGVMVIAELLDHSDIQNASVYTRDHPNFRAWLDKSVGEQLAPVAAAFAGKVVDTEADARHGDNPAMRVGTRNQKVGTCGSDGWCGAKVPVACYTCMHFQALLHAPHHKALAWMRQERQRRLDAGASETVARSIDPSIQAAEAVIVACSARKSEQLEHENAKGNGFSIEGTA